MDPGHFTLGHRFHRHGLMLGPNSCSVPVDEGSVRSPLRTAQRAQRLNDRINQTTKMPLALY